MDRRRGCWSARAWSGVCEIPVRRQDAIAQGAGEVAVANDVALTAGRAPTKDELSGEVAGVLDPKAVECSAHRRPAVRIGAIAGRLVGHLKHAPIEGFAGEHHFARSEYVPARRQVAT